MNERTLVPEFAIYAQNWTKIAMAEKKDFFGVFAAYLHFTQAQQKTNKLEELQWKQKLNRHNRIENQLFSSQNHIFRR